MWKNWNWVLFAFLVANLAANGVGLAQNPGIENAGTIKSDGGNPEELNAEVSRLCGQRQFSEALPIARKLLEIREKTVGKRHITYGSALANVGNIQFALREYANAVESLTAALDVLELNSANVQPGVFRTWMNRGYAAYELNNFQLAQSSFSGAMQCLKVGKGPEKEKLIETFSALGRTSFSLNDLFQAGKYFAQKFLLIEPAKRATTPIEYLELPTMKLVMATAPRDGQFPFYKFASVVTLPDGTEKFEFEIPESDFVSASTVSRFLPRELSRTIKDHRLGTKAAVLLTVGQNGKVEQTVYLAGGPLFQSPSIEAGNRWRFKPALYRGSPVKQTLLVIFTLQFNS